MKNKTVNRIVLLGVEHLNECSWITPEDLIVGIMDVNPGWHSKKMTIQSENGILFDGLIAGPEDLKSLDFDYVVILSHYDLWDAFDMLEAAGIRDDRIVSRDCYVGRLQGHPFYSYDVEYHLVNYLYSLHVKYLLDYDMFFSCGTMYCIDSMELEGCDFTGDKKLLPIHENLYRHVYHNWEECRYRHYDAIFLTGYRTYEETMGLLRQVMHMARHVIIRFIKDSDAVMKFREPGSPFAGKCAWLTGVKNDIAILTAKEENDIGMYVCMHKPYDLPELPPIYRPIHAGKAGKEGFGVPGDDTGENISELNPYLNELTAMYWMWKNTSHDIVGLCHYRRYITEEFYKGKDVSGHVLTEESIRNILLDYDIILTIEFVFRKPYGVHWNLSWYLNPDLYEKSVPIIRKWLEIRQPDYLSAFDYVGAHQGLYRCNMFVTRKHVFDAYAEWLFSFLIDAHHEFDYTGLDTLGKRIMGFWGEILINVWLVKQHVRIKELYLWENTD